MKIDLSRPHGLVCGDSRVRYVQDGKEFAADGSMLEPKPYVPIQSVEVLIKTLPETELLPSIVGPNVIESMIELAKGLPEGAFVEVGVYRGGTASHLAKLAKSQGRKIYLYDTFEGMPYKGELDSHPIGDFADTSFEEVVKAIPYAKVIKGVFPESADKRVKKVAFAHLDCDQYQSVKESAEYLKPLMVSGGVMWFDDYGCLDGATKAVEELFGKEIERVSGKGIVRF